MSRSRIPNRSQMTPRMRLGDFLVAYLRRMGVEHVFGLPGDLVLGLFNRFGQECGVEVITFSGEPAVGFAADGYARSTRRLGVACVTYGAGGHNIVNPVGGAYAEQVPLLIVSGGPGEAEQAVARVHHQVKDVEGQFRILSEATCAARIVNRPAQAAQDIHDVVTAIMQEYRPGYVEIHRDMVEVMIDVPRSIREWDGKFPRPGSDRRKLSEAVSESLERLRVARRPLLIGGVELFRESTERNLWRLAEQLGAPVLTTVLAKGVFPMYHPLHMGVHMGSFSPKAIRAAVKPADLVLALGTQLTDLNLAAAQPQVSRDASIWASEGRVTISFHEYTDVTLADFTRQLAAKVPKRRGQKVQYYDNLKPRADRAGRDLSVGGLLVELNRFLAAHGGYSVVVESGDTLFGGLELRLRDGLYLAQGLYASMGFGMPAALGMQIGTGQRPLVLTGDGAFQMTGPELSHALSRGLNPVVVLVNNGGWGIFRPVSQRTDLLDLPNWPYAEMARGWGGSGTVVKTASALREALEQANSQPEFSLIECRVPADDLSPLSRRYIQASARKG